MAVELQRRLINAAEYHLMQRAGILTADDKVELLRGEIIHMSPRSSQHSNTVRRITQLLYQKVASSTVISVQEPISMSDLSEPEPDVALLSQPHSKYQGRHPQPLDVLLLIEVSLSTLESDRTIKLPLYSEAGIPECWIVNLQEGEVEVYRQPLADGYRVSIRYKPGEDIPLPSLGVSLAVSDILGTNS